MDEIIEAQPKLDSPHLTHSHIYPTLSFVSFIPSLPHFVLPSHIHTQHIQDTHVTVDKMQRELNELRPILAQKTIDTERLLVQVGATTRC